MSKADTSLDLATQLIHAGRDKNADSAAVNPPVVRASTICFKNQTALKKALTAQQQGHTDVLLYGRRGTDTHFALADAFKTLEQADGAVLFPSGAAAIAASIMAFCRHGDEVLIPDAVYSPTRDFADDVLSRFGVTAVYYPPLADGDALESYITANTKILFLESPGSLTLECQDLTRLIACAKRHHLLTIMDNTYGAGVLCKPLALGVDISIQAATKYAAGHSDVMMGVACANGEVFKTLNQQSYLMGYCVSADDAYQVLKGMRTLVPRLRLHQAAAMEVAAFCQNQFGVHAVHHPSLPTCPGHTHFKEHFSGSNGLFSLVMQKGIPKRVIDDFVDNLSLFAIGYSWGGFESLVSVTHSLHKLRSATQHTGGSVVRLHIGLEATKDLIDCLAKAFQKMAQDCQKL